MSLVVAVLAAVVTFLLLHFAATMQTVVEVVLSILAGLVAYLLVRYGAGHLPRSSRNP